MMTFYAGPKTEPELNRMIAEFVSGVIWGSPDQFEKYATMGVFDHGNLVAGTVYHNWQPAAGVIELSSASLTKRWLTRSVIKAMFTMPFDQWGCQLCVLRVSEKNHGMVAIARKYGFSEVFIPRLRSRHEGEFIFTLTDDDWRSDKFRSLVHERLRAGKDN